MKKKSAVENSSEENFIKFHLRNWTLKRILKELPKWIITEVKELWAIPPQAICSKFLMNQRTTSKQNKEKVTSGSTAALSAHKSSSWIRK